MGTINYNNNLEILLSKPKGTRHDYTGFLEKFSDLLYSSDSVYLATGYFSVDSALYLHEIVKQKFLSSFEMIIGMLAKEGFTRAQYEAAVNFNGFLKENRIGQIYVSPAVAYHGKLYTFSSKGQRLGAIVGSSNISNFSKQKDSIENLEVDIFFPKGDALEGFSSVYAYIKSLACPLELWKPTAFKPIRNDLLKDCEGAERVSEEVYESFWKRTGKLRFRIPLKPEAKSNLNVYYGKGRVDARERVRPRPWYEVEIILDARVYNQPGFPKPSSDKPIRIITDDGWSFLCYRGGSNDKNLRTIGDLKILGMWIKGRMEEAGVLKPGEKITYEMLDRYGRRDLELISTAEPDKWLFDFRRPS